jgi:hypothetical protein
MPDDMSGNRKSILVSEDTHKELSILKYRNEFSSYEELFEEKLIDE